MFLPAIRLFLISVCFLCLAFVSLTAQTNSVPASTNTPATNVTPPITPLALSDVVNQAPALIAKLRDDQSRLASDQITQIVSGGLPVLTRQVDERLAADESLLSESPSLSSLQNSQQAWQSLAEMSASEKALSDHARQVDDQIAQLDQLNKTWQATLAAATKAPPEIIQQIKSVLAALADATKAAQKAQAQILAVQTRIATQNARISDGQDRITQAMQVARKQLFERDHPLLWSAPEASSSGPGIFAQEKVSLYHQLEELISYFQDKIGAVLIHVLILISLLLGLRWIRKVIRSLAEEKSALQQAVRVFDVPVATALLLALLATDWLYPLAPRLLWAVVGAIALIPAVIIIRRLIESANFVLLYATVIAYFVDQIRYIATPAGLLSRYIDIFELLAASIFLLWVLRSKNLDPGPEQNRLKLVTRFYLHLAFIVFIFAGFANAFGFVRLSILVGNAMLESSYLAVVIYAAVRVADALLISALNLRPLSQLGMVRRHQDLLYQNITVGVRWLSFAIWLITVLQLFSLRDPLWQELNRILDTRLPWFSLAWPIRDLLALPITIWASFLLSRFIRFALEEEVYPQLNLGRGIPYAASTMVHYTILFIGFFAALSAAKIDLSQFSILAGAFGVGLGFGLQNIMNNFVSGIILLFERPIKVGDVIQLDVNVGTVERIGIRASVILLSNGSEMIVPNGNLISNPVTNWTLSNCERLIEIPVKVVSQAAPENILRLLTEVAKAHPSVLKNPPPQALLITFGGAVFTYRLRAWVDSEEDWPKISSDLALAINSTMARENITLG